MARPDVARHPGPRMRGRRTSILARRFEDLSPEADMAYFAHGFQ